MGFLLVCQDVPPELFTSKQLLHHRLLLLSPRDSARVEVCRPTHYTSHLGGEEKEINIGSTPHPHLTANKKYRGTHAWKYRGASLESLAL